MTTTINGTAGVTFPAGGVGNPAGAVVGTTDTQTLTNKTLTTPNIDSAQIATVSGTAPLYMARAWVNFNGTTNVGGFCTIRASGNVTSVTDDGVGKYTVNFTTAMTDANYAAITGFTTPAWTSVTHAFTYLTSSVKVECGNGTTPTLVDPAVFTVAIFR